MQSLARACHIRGDLLEVEIPGELVQIRLPVGAYMRVCVVLGQEGDVKPGSLLLDELIHVSAGSPAVIFGVIPLGVLKARFGMGEPHPFGLPQMLSRLVVPGCSSDPEVPGPTSTGVVIQVAGLVGVHVDVGHWLYPAWRSCDPG